VRKKKETNTARRWLRDYEVQQLRPEFTASRLRKDRLGPQLFPFHRIGRDCWYDLPEMDATVAAAKFGGKAA
jgi:hypothetical protein